MIMLLRTSLLERDIEKNLNVPNEILAELLSQFSRGAIDQRFSLDPLWEPLSPAAVDGWRFEMHGMAIDVAVELTPSWEQVTPGVDTLEELSSRLLKERGWREVVS